MNNAQVKKTPPKILVHTDCSLAALETIQFAASIGNRANADLILNFWENGNCEDKTLLKVLVDNANLANAKIMGSLPLSRLIADRGAYDFVIFGRHVKKACKFINQSPKPVLVVKENPGWMDQITFFSFFNEKDHQIFRHVLELADILECRIKFVYLKTPFINQNEEKIRLRLQKFADEYPDYNITYEIPFGKYTVEGIVDYINENDIGIAAIPNEGRKSWKRLIRPNLFEFLVRLVTKPLMIIPEGA